MTAYRIESSLRRRSEKVRLKSFEILIPVDKTQAKEENWRNDSQHEINFTVPYRSQAFRSSFPLIQETV